MKHIFKSLNLTFILKAVFKPILSQGLTADATTPSSSWWGDALCFWPVNGLPVNPRWPTGDAARIQWHLLPAGEPWTGISAPFTLNAFKGAAPAAQQQHSQAREWWSPCKKNHSEIQVPVQVIFQWNHYWQERLPKFDSYWNNANSSSFLSALSHLYLPGSRFQALNVFCQAGTIN